MSGPGLFDRDLIKTASPDIVVTVPVKTVTISRFAPVLGSTVIVPVNTVTLTTFAPTVVKTTIITVPVASLTTTRFAPVLKSTIVVPVKTVTTARFAPVLKSTIVVPVRTVSVSAFAPVLKSTIIVPVRAATLTTFAPTVVLTLAGTDKTVTVPTASLTLATFAPTVVLTESSEIPLSRHGIGSFLRPPAPRPQQPRLLEPFEIKLKGPVELWLGSVEIEVDGSVRSIVHVSPAINVELRSDAAAEGYKRKHVEPLQISVLTPSIELEGAIEVEDDWAEVVIGAGCGLVETFRR